MEDGEALKVVAPQAQLLPLPPACAASVPAVGALTGGGCHPCELGEAVPGMEPLPGGAAYGYGLSKHLVSKGVGVS